MSPGDIMQVLRAGETAHDKGLQYFEDLSDDVATFQVVVRVESKLKTLVLMKLLLLLSV